MKFRTKILSFITTLDKDEGECVRISGLNASHNVSANFEDGNSILIVAFLNLSSARAI